MKKRRRPHRSSVDQRGRRMLSAGLRASMHSPGAFMNRIRVICTPLQIQMSSPASAGLTGKYLMLQGCVNRSRCIDEEAGKATDDAHRSRELEDDFPGAGDAAGLERRDQNARSRYRRRYPANRRRSVCRRADWRRAVSLQRRWARSRARGRRIRTQNVVGTFGGFADEDGSSMEVRADQGVGWSVRK